MAAPRAVRVIELGPDGAPVYPVRGGRAGVPAPRLYVGGVGAC